MRAFLVAACLAARQFYNANPAIHVSFQSWGQASERRRGFEPTPETQQSLARSRHEQAQHNPFAGLYYVGDAVAGAMVGVLVGGGTGNVWPDPWVTRYP
jgi:hypothetical protein